ANDSVDSGCFVMIIRLSEPSGGGCGEGRRRCDSRHAGPASSCSRSGGLVTPTPNSPPRAPPRCMEMLSRMPRTTRHHWCVRSVPHLPAAPSVQALRKSGPPETVPASRPPPTRPPSLEVLSGQELKDLFDAQLNPLQGPQVVGHICNWPKRAVAADVVA